MSTNGFTTADDALRAWDNGETVWSIEMGRLGPSYEQCIHILVFEMVRGWLSHYGANATDNSPLAFGEVAQKIATKLDETFHFSGAQVAAAKSLAWGFLDRGYVATLKKKSDRLIQVKRSMPSAPPPGY